jgi:release factor glutamine methyltransferase
VLAVNAPYVPTVALATMPPEARLHEPRVALDGGADGLEVLRRVISEAPEWLAPGGHLLVESSTTQGPHLAEAMRASGFDATVERSAAVAATVVIGVRPPTRRHA